MDLGEYNERVREDAERRFRTEIVPEIDSEYAEAVEKYVSRFAWTLGTVGGLVGAGAGAAIGTYFIPEDAELVPFAG